MTGNKTFKIVLAIIFTISILYVLDVGSIFSSPEHPTLGQVMSDYDNKKLGFKSYDDGDTIIIKDTIDKAEYNPSRNVTIIRMKSYPSHEILFKGNLKETHNSTLNLENSEIVFTVTIINHKGIEHIREFFIPKDVK